MSKLEETSQFQSEVLKAEFEEIVNRRNNVEEALGQTREELDTAPTINNQLVGLACSGGGIRSASFSMGVIQYLISHGLFKKVDYLSTVSGGGYTGSCISAMTKDNPGAEKLLTDRVDGAEPAALNHIRNYSEYLKSEGTGSGFRIPILFIEGVLRSILTFLPIVILAVFLTELFFEFTGRFSTAVQWGLPIAGVVPLMLLLGYRPIVMGRFNWVRRDKGDATLIKFSLLALASIIAIPFLSLLRQVVELDASSLQAELSRFVSNHIPHLSVVSILIGACVVYGVIKLKKKLIVVLASVMAPMSLVMLYIFLCVHSINSPYVHKEEIARHLLAARDSLDVAWQEDFDLKKGTGTDAGLEAAPYESDIETKIRTAIKNPSIILEVFRSGLLDPASIKAASEKELQLNSSRSDNLSDTGAAPELELGGAKAEKKGIPSEEVIKLSRELEGEVGDAKAITRCADDHNKEKYLDYYLPVEFFASVLTQKHIQICDYGTPTVIEGALVFERLEKASLLDKLFTSASPNTVRLSVQEEVMSSKPILVLDDLKLLNGHAEWWLYAAGILIQIYNWIFINVNRFSLHPFYRDRLSRTFLITPKRGKITHVDELKMSELNGPKSTAPYHIVNTALNLQGSPNPQLRSRKTVPFILTKRHCGSDLTGYCKTKDLESVDKHFNLATAMAISAAAASPNMGTMGKKSLSFLLTLLNVRLNYWLPHPDKVRNTREKKSFPVRPLGLSYLMKEALAKVDEKHPYVNLSDGGHIENLAVYELLRRQCRTIICIDAEADPTFSFFGLITLQRYAEIDLGIKLDIDLTGIRPEAGVSARNYSIGHIRYPNGDTGKIVYLKLSFTGNEAEYLHYYRSQNPTFPHQSTSDQFFDETQFEVYRALGNYVAESAGDDLKSVLTS